MVEKSEYVKSTAYIFVEVCMVISILVMFQSGDTIFGKQYLQEKKMHETMNISAPT